MVGTQKSWTVRLQKGQAPFQISNLMVSFTQPDVLRAIFTAAIPEISVCCTLSNYNDLLLFLFIPHSFCSLIKLLLRIWAWPWVPMTLSSMTIFQLSLPVLTESVYSTLKFLSQNSYANATHFGCLLRSGGWGGSAVHVVPRGLLFGRNQGFINFT